MVKFGRTWALMRPLCFGGSRLAWLVWLFAHIFCSWQGRFDFILSLQMLFCCLLQQVEEIQREIKLLICAKPIWCLWSPGFWKCFFFSNCKHFSQISDYLYCSLRLEKCYFIAMGYWLQSLVKSIHIRSQTPARRLFAIGAFCLSRRHSAVDFQPGCSHRDGWSLCNADAA